LLASYSTERQPSGARIVNMTTEFFEGTTGVKGDFAQIDAETPEGESLRASIGRQLSEVTAREFRTLGLQLGYWYEDSPICVADGTPPPPNDPHEYHASARPGSRAPHVKLSDGSSIMDRFGPGFTLLCLSPVAPDTGPMARAAAARKLPLDIVKLANDEMRAEVLRIYERNFVLVRPDGHVAWRADELPSDPLVVIDRVRGA
jgi:hypothetical protein